MLLVLSSDSGTKVRTGADQNFPNIPSSADSIVLSYRCGLNGFCRRYFATITSGLSGILETHRLNIRTFQCMRYVNNPSNGLPFPRV